MSEREFKVKVPKLWKPSSNFCNFHQHSKFSKLDCLIKIDQLAQKVVDLGGRAIAVSDHGNMGSLWELWKCTQELKEYDNIDIKPLYGIEFYFVDDRNNRDERAYNHLTCYAMNLQGLQNLMYLTSSSYITGMYGKPRIDWELLKSHGEGIVGLSGCIIGKIPELLVKGEELQAMDALNKFKSVFNGHFYLELQPSSLDFQIKINDLLVKFGEKTDTKVVMTTDSHYLEKQDFNIHETMLCIQTQSVLSDPKRFSFECPEFYYADEKDIEERINVGHQDSVKEAFRASIDNTLEIVNLCNVDLDFKEVYFPTFPVPEKEEEFHQYWNKAKCSSLV